MVLLVIDNSEARGKFSLKFRNFKTHFTVFVFPRVGQQKYDLLRGRGLNKEKYFKTNFLYEIFPTRQLVCLDIHCLLCEGCLLIPPTEAEEGLDIRNTSLD